LVVEKMPYIGGAWTGGMVTHIAGLVDHSRIFQKNEKVLNPENWIVQGLACDYHRYLHRYGAARGAHWDHEAGKVIFDLILQDEGVEILYGTHFFSAAVSARKVRSVELIYRTTKLQIEADFFIDASGDGDLGAAAGCAFHFGRETDGKMSPATLSYMIGGIDEQHVISEEDYGAPIGGKGGLIGEQRDREKEDLNVLIKIASEKGLIPPDVRPAAICNKYAEGKDRNELWCSFVRQWGNITDPWDYSRMERDGRIVGWKVFRYLRENTQSCKDAYLSSLCNQIWPRECRHFQTRYVITAEDFRQEARFDDVVARDAFYLDLHSVTPHSGGFDLDERHEEYDRYFEIPYRALIPLDVDNLLFAGRTIGADHYGHSATRVMGTGIATGQAAGTAAALILRQKLDASLNLEVSLLQKTLREQGVVI